MSRKLSTETPYPTQYIEVLGSKMAYVASGEGDPILFLHGNPTSKYLWRNIMPWLENQGRVIAPDLIGMGESDKPDIDYTYQDHYEYLLKFIQTLDLKNVTLVIQDWGSGLGFNYAAQQEDNIKGIVFLEALVRPLASEMIPEKERAFVNGIRTPGIGEEIILNQNAFVERFIPDGVIRQLSKAEMDIYRAPFPTPESRKPVLVFPREIPIDGEPLSVHKIVANYYDWLQKTQIPKLMFHVTPGAIITDEVANELKGKFTHMESVFLGEGGHFLQEDYPHEIGEKIAEWYSKI